MAAGKELMTLTPDQVERTLQEHRATTDERFSRLIDELQHDRERRERDAERLGSLETRLVGFEGFMESVADDLKDLTKNFHAPKGRTPWFAGISAMVAVLTLIGFLVVGYVSREIAHATQLSAMLDKADKEKEVVRLAGANKLDATMKEFLTSSLVHLTGQIEANTQELVARGKADARAQAFLENQIKVTDHADEMRHWLDTRVRKLEREEAAAAVQDIETKGRIIDHTHKQGSAGHPPNERVIRTEGPLGVQQRGAAP